jgi:hypothetical protein
VATALYVIADNLPVGKAPGHPQLGEESNDELCLTLTSAS